jgi:hypothetical protein
MSSATIPVVEETVAEDLWSYKREEKPSTQKKEGRGIEPKIIGKNRGGKNREKTEGKNRGKLGGRGEWTGKINPKTEKTEHKKKPEQRNNTRREGEERNPAYIENCSCYCLHLCRRPCIKKPTQNPDLEVEGEASTVLSSSSQGLRKQRKTKKTERTVGIEAKESRSESYKRRRAIALPPSTPSPENRQVIFLSFFCTFNLVVSLHCAKVN